MEAKILLAQSGLHRRIPNEKCHCFPSEAMLKGSPTCAATSGSFVSLGGYTPWRGFASVYARAGAATEGTVDVGGGSNPTRSRWLADTHVSHWIGPAHIASNWLVSTCGAGGRCAVTFAAGSYGVQNATWVWPVLSYFVKHLLMFLCEFP